MAERIRFPLDENIDPDVARAVRRYGIDVTTTYEAGLRSLSDAKQIEFIHREGRVIATHDVDFLRFAGSHYDHPGIVYCASARHSTGEIIRTLILIYEVLSPEEMVGRVDYL